MNQTTRNDAVEKERIQLSASRNLDWERATTFVFDFDGTIADTESVHYLAYNDVLSREFDQRISIEEFRSYVGRPRTTVLAEIKRSHGISFDDDRFTQIRKESFLGLIGQTGLKPFSYFTRHLEEHPKAKRVLLSAQDIDLIKPVIAQWGISDAFSKTISTSTGSSKRSHLQKLESTGVIAIRDTAYLEDSPENIVAGNDLGLTTVGIQTNTNRLLRPSACSYLIDARSECVPLAILSERTGAGSGQGHRSRKATLP